MNHLEKTPPTVIGSYFLLREDLRLRGTFAPARRACERPMAIACLRLFTFLPERPLRSVPRLRSRIACRTFWDAFLPYFRAIETPRFDRSLYSIFAFALSPRSSSSILLCANLC